MWFICLLFLTDKKHHQEALSDMKGVGDTATLTAVMAQHLFSPLIAGNDYVIDNRSENLPRCMYCPCEKENCKALMNSGCTALGRYMCPVFLQQFFTTHYITTVLIRFVTDCLQKYRYTVLVWSLSLMVYHILCISVLSQLQT